MRRSERAGPAVANLEHRALTALAADDFAVVASLAASFSRREWCDDLEGEESLRRAELRRLLYSGSLDSARRACERLIVADDETAVSRPTVAFAYIVLARAATEHHSLPEAHDYLRCATVAADPATAVLDRELRLARARLTAAWGEPASALWWLAPLFERPQQWAPSLLLEPGLLAWTVRTALDASTPDVTKSLLGWTAQFVVEMASCVGLALAFEQARALLDRDARALSRVAEVLADRPRRLVAAEAHEYAGRAFSSSSGRLEAVAQYHRAAELYASAGAQLGARRVHARLRRLHAVVHRHAVRGELGWDSLTTTEGSVAQLVAEGLTNRQVGEVLFMSRFTVDTHLRRIFAKLQLNSRVALADAVTQRRSEAMIDGVLTP